MIYAVKSLKDLHNVIIPHFTKYPLLTQKRADFLLFKEICSIILENKHYTPEGLQRIINNKASMN